MFILLLEKLFRKGMLHQGMKVEKLDGFSVFKYARTRALWDWSLGDWTSSASFEDGNFWLRPDVNGKNLL